MKISRHNLELRIILKVAARIDGWLMSYWANFSDRRPVTSSLNLGRPSVTSERIRGRSNKIDNSNRGHPSMIACDDVAGWPRSMAFHKPKARKSQIKLIFRGKSSFKYVLTIYRGVLSGKTARYGKLMINLLCWLECQFRRYEVQATQLVCWQTKLLRVGGMNLQWVAHILNKYFRNVASW